MKRLTFDGMTISIPEEQLQEDLIDIDFNGVMLVQFEKQSDGTFKPRNAMNGHGQNCYLEIKDKELLIEDETIIPKIKGSVGQFSKGSLGCDDDPEQRGFQPK